MKPFNLEEYLKNPPRKVVTRDGRPVRIICTDRKGATPIIALVNDGLSEELCYSFYPDGKTYENYKSEIDLFFAPEKKVGWVNVYHEDNRLKCGNVYNTESEAKLHSRNANRLATVKIEWED